MLEALVGILGAACLAIIGWAFNINSEVKVLQQRDESMKELIETRFDALDGRLDRSDNRLDRIERVLNHADIQ